MQNVENARTTESAMSRYWRRSTPAQQVRMQEEFPRPVDYTYANALRQFDNQTITLLRQA